MSKKYLLMGSTIIASDGDLHFISANELCYLYKLNPKECIFADQRYPETYRGYNLENIIELRPRYDGNYSLIANNGESV